MEYADGTEKSQRTGTQTDTPCHHGDLWPMQFYQWYGASIGMIPKDRWLSNLHS